MSGSLQGRIESRNASVRWGEPFADRLADRWAERSLNRPDLACGAIHIDRNVSDLGHRDGKQPRASSR